MAYLVNVTARAGFDLAHLYREINAEQSDAALKWYRGFREAMLSLEEQPNRGPVTPESDKLRHLLYGNKPHIYRAIPNIGKGEAGRSAAHPPRRTAEVQGVRCYVRSAGIRTQGC